MKLSPMFVAPAGAAVSFARLSARLGALLMIAAMGLLGGCGGSDDPAPTPAATEPLIAAPGRATALKTDRELDLAIVGDGMFTFIDAEGRTVYSRTAQLGLDLDNRLSNAEGLLLAGRPAAASTAGEVQALGAVPMSMPAQASSKISIKGNLPQCALSEMLRSFSAVGSIGLGGVCPHHLRSFNPMEALNQTNSIGLKIVDFEGKSSDLVLYFLLRSIGWEVFAELDGKMISDSTGEILPFAMLNFSFDGVIVGQSLWTLTVPVPGGTAAGDLTLEVDMSGISRFEAPFAMSNSSVDGHQAGTLQTISMTKLGRIDLHYNNGETVPHGSVLLSDFALADRLRAVGQTGWLCESQCSGPRHALPTEQLTGELATGFLEPTVR